MPQEKLKTMLMQNFGGANKVYYGRCESGELRQIHVNWQVVLPSNNADQSTKTVGSSNLYWGVGF